MTKSEVEAGYLGQYVVMPEACTMSFTAWWKTLNNSDTVDVRYLHERHGLAGRASNAAKADAKLEFLSFINLNSQPNGRRWKSQIFLCHTFVFAKFRTIQTPNLGVANYTQGCSNKL